MKRVSVKSSCGRTVLTTCSTPGFCRPMAFSIPAGVSQIRCGGLPRRGLPVVPFRTMAPASRFENPSTRVYSSPKPTQPESSTIGEAKSRPQKVKRSAGRSAAVPGRVPAAASGVALGMTGIIAQPRRSPARAMFHVVLFQPEIPPNTGNVIRLCANTGATLHLVRPLGFELTKKAVRRAGLDYAELALVRVHPGLAACLEALDGARLFSIETGGTRPYSEAAFGAGDAFLFGPETRGLPARALALVPRERRLAIPMRARNRSLNLANAVALVVYEAWRQRGFAGSEPLEAAR